MLSLLAFLSLSAFATTENNFTYQAQVVAGSADCATEAANWSQKFAKATGAKIKTAVCRGEQVLNADNKTYKAYNLGLSYSAPTAYYPYAISIGKRDSMAPTRPNLEPLYPTMDSCLADVAIQAAHYEAQTALKAVSATCVADSPYATVTQYFLNIEGFDGNKNFSRAQPKKSLYTFAPYAFEDLQVSRQVEIKEFILAYDAAIVKEATGVFVYYRADGALPLNAEDVIVTRNAAECEAQLAVAHEIYLKAGSKQVITWCHEERLEVIHDGSYYLNQMVGANPTQYGTFEQCVADKEFVLSDVRNGQALGAVCAPGTSDFKSYSMTLFRRGY